MKRYITFFVILALLVSLNLPAQNLAFAAPQTDIHAAPAGSPAADMQVASTAQSGLPTFDVQAESSTLDAQAAISEAVTAVTPPAVSTAVPTESSTESTAPVPLLSAGIVTTLPPITTETPAPIAPKIQAASAMLINAKTGEVLWRKNSDDVRPMASTTKIMTALVAIEQGNLDDMVTVRPGALGPGRLGGVWLAAGEQVQLRDLLYALLMRSANDAAVAIADHVGGSVGGFADMMNAKALALGATNTRFTNPHGLDNPYHYSTARDLATIARYAFQNETFQQIIGTKSWRMTRASSNVPKSLSNTNKLLQSYSGYDGGKTGYTRGARNCLVSQATRDDVTLISVVLGARNRNALWAESAALLDFGFPLYEQRRLIKIGTTYKTLVSSHDQNIDLVAAEDITTVVRGALPVYLEAHYEPGIDAPVQKGAVLGKLIAYQAGQVVAESNLIAKEDVFVPAFNPVVSNPWVQFADTTPAAELAAQPEAAAAAATVPPAPTPPIPAAPDLASNPLEGFGEASALAASLWPAFSSGDPAQNPVNTGF